MKRNDIVTRYFESWGGYKVPFVPSGEISPEKALTLEVYYVGVYLNDVLTSFEKIVDHEREWIDEYEYWNESKILKERRSEKANGTTIIQKFDKRGKIVL